MAEFYNGQNGELINVMSPCAPGCHVEISIDGDTISAPTSGIGWERLYELEGAKDDSITLNYSREKGAYVTHASTNTTFILNGKIDVHPIAYALRNCFSRPKRQTAWGWLAASREGRVVGC